VVNPVPIPFVLNWGPMNGQNWEKEMPNWLKPLFLHFHEFLYFQDLTAVMSSADSGGLGETFWFVDKHSRGFQIVPSLCLCSSTRPIEAGSIASSNATESHRSVPPPVVRNCQLILNVIPRMVGCQMAENIDWAATYQPRCDCAVFFRYVQVQV